MKTILALLIVLGIAGTGCTDDERSKQTLEDYGFTRIEITGYEPWKCGDDYTYSTGFTADNPQNRRVRGVVCCGMVKGCTVKF